MILKSIIRNLFNKKHTPRIDPLDMLLRNQLRGARVAQADKIVYGIPSELDVVETGIAHSGSSDDSPSSGWQSNTELGTEYSSLLGRLKEAEKDDALLSIFEDELYGLIKPVTSSNKPDIDRLDMLTEVRNTLWEITDRRDLKTIREVKNYDLLNLNLEPDFRSLIKDEDIPIWMRIDGRWEQRGAYSFTLLHDLIRTIEKRLTIRVGDHLAKTRNYLGFELEKGKILICEVQLLIEPNYCYSVKLGEFVEGELVGPILQSPI